MTIFDAHGVLTFRARHRIRESLKGGGGILYYLYLSSNLENKGNYTLYTTMANLLDFKMIFSWKPRSKRNFSVYWDNIHAPPSR